MTDYASLFQQRMAGSQQALDAVVADLEYVTDIAEAVVGVLQNGGTVYTCGNGGSAAEALHLSEELIGRYRGDRPAQRAACLNADPTVLTCIANDFGFQHVYSRQCEALLTDDDALVVFTTSGKSANIVNALQVAAKKDALRIGLLGGDGGACADLCEHKLIVPMNDSAHVQEAHQIVMHLICEAVEHEFSV